METNAPTSHAPATDAPATAPAARPATAAGPAIQRQFVNFAYYKLDPSFRRLPEGEKHSARQEFITLMNNRIPGLMCLTYSTIGLRPDCDFLLWRIGQSTDQFQHTIFRGDLRPEQYKIVQ